MRDRGMAVGCSIVTLVNPMGVAFRLDEAGSAGKCTVPGKKQHDAGIQVA